MTSEPLVVSVPDQEYAASLADVDGADVVVWDMAQPHPRGAEIQFAVVPYMTSLRLPDIAPGLDSLRVVQIQSAGFEQFADGLPEDVVLCNAAGVHDASTAELAVALTLASIREIPALLAAQADSRWEPLRIRPCLADSAVLVLGYGRIGRAIARRLAPFEVTTTAGARRARAGDDVVDHVHGIEELPDILPRHDVVIVIVPLTEQTHHLVDADLLARMRDGALLVNVSRGPVVDTDALAAECASGRLRAALDVTDPEPLPVEHRLWTTPGVIITPHIGGATRAMRPRAMALIRRQVEAMLGGRELDNVVAVGS